MDNELQTVKFQAPSSPNEMYLDVGMFEQAQRVAKMLSTSTMVPDHFRGNIGNCMIALNFASRVNLDPFMAMQSMYIVHGKPGLEGKLAIALLNKSGSFTSLQFRFEGEGRTRSCTAYATRISTGDVCEQTVSMAMVEAEGWKKNKKWVNMPDLMFQYRSASFFIKVHAPEVLMGMQTKEELDDINGYNRPQYHQETTVSSANDAFTNQLPEPKPEPEPVMDIEPNPTNPLHETPEGRQWMKDSEMFPELSAGMQEPTTTEQCVEACKQLNKIVSERDAEK